MSIAITNEELDTFSKNGISEQNIADTVKIYRDEGLSDDQIRQKFDAKLNSFNTVQKPATNTNTVAKPITEQTEEKPLTYQKDKPFELNAEYVPTYEELSNEYKKGNLTKQQLIDLGKKRKDLDFKEADDIVKRTKARNFIGGTLVGLGSIPLLNLPLTGALGGGLVGWGNGILNYKSAKDTAKEAGAGAGLGFALGKLPALGQAIGKTKVGQAIGSKAGELTEKGLEKIASSELGANVLGKLDDIGNFLTKERQLPNFKRPQTNSIVEQVQTKRPISLSQLKKDINSNKFDKRNLTVVKNRYKNRNYSIVYDTEDNADIYAEREFNDLIKEISKNPQQVRNPQQLQALENKVQEILNKSPNPDVEEYTQPYWEKFVKAVDDAEKYNVQKYGEQSAMIGRDIPKDAQFTDEYEVAESRLPKTADLPDYIKNEINANPPEYEVLHNNDLMLQAQNDIANTNPETEISLLKERAALGNKEKFSALDFEKSRQLASKLLAEGRNDEAMSLIEATSKKASEAGQAVQALSLWSKTTPEGALSFAQKTINKYNKEMGKNLKLTDEQILKIEELANNLQNASEGREQEIATAQLMKYFQELTPASWNKKLDTYRYMNMLLSGKSRIKDFLLTGLNSVDNAIDETIANGIDRVRTLIPGQQRAFNGLKPKEWFSGLNKGFKEGVEDVKLGINTSRSGEQGRYGLAKTPSFTYRPLNSVDASQLLPQTVENLLAGGEKALNYSIQVPDRMFYEARFNSSLADQMAAAGVDKPTTEMIEQATKEAKEAVYQDDSWVSKLGNTTRNAINDITGSIESSLGLNNGTIPRAGDVIVPFVTTPANIVNQGLKNTVGAIPGSIKLATAKNPQQIRDAEMLIAKNIKGLMPLGLGLGIGKGLIDSNIGSDNYQRDAVTGLKPQSVVIGDKAVSFKDYPQWSIPMSIGAGYAQGGTGQALVNAGKAVSDISALKTLGDMVGNIQGRYGQDLTSGEIADNMIRTLGVNALGQLVPFAGELGELRNDIDPYARELYTPNTGNYIANRMINRIPFASKTLPQKYNAVGEPVYANNIQNPLLRALSESVDLGVRNYTPNKAYDTFNDYQNSIKDSDIRGKTTVGMKNAPRTVEIDGEKVKLDNKQYSKFQKDYGRLDAIVKQSLLDSDIYQAMTDEEKVKTISDYRKAVKQAVMYKLFNQEPKRPSEYLQDILDLY